MTAPLSPLLRLVGDDPGFADLLGRSNATVAVPDAVRSFVLAEMARRAEARVLVVATPTSNESERIEHDLRAFIDPSDIELFPAWETLPFERISPAINTMGQRLRTLHRVVATANSTDPGRTLVVVASIKALLQRLATHADEGAPLLVKPGLSTGTDELVAWLVNAGYRREYQVEHRGEVAVRGGIVDVFPPTLDFGIRIDCFGDEVDRLTAFDVSAQRSVRDLDSVEIFPCRELFFTEEIRERAAALAKVATAFSSQFASIALGESFPGVESFLPWISKSEELLPSRVGDESAIVLLDPRRMRDRASELIDEEAALASSLSATWGIEKGSQASLEFPRLHLDFESLLRGTRSSVASILSVTDSPDTASITATGWPAATGDATALARRIGDLARQGYAIAVASETLSNADRFAYSLESEGVTIDRSPAHLEPGESTGAIALPGVHSVVASIDHGFILTGSKVAVLSERDLTGRRQPHRVPHARTRPVEGFFDDLAPGSFVVHHVHGVARYEGMVTRTIAGAERDYLLLSYRGDDKLYVPSDQIDTITPYSGGERPTLNRLNGSEWSRQTSKVRRAVREIAQELVVLYQRRLATPGHAFSADTPWQVEMEQSFPYPETPDQQRAIDEAKADMERPVPMDRLVCGDVGFGKTEVAIRSVFKAVQDGMQAAVLVPTTLLAQQHFQTFSERYSSYPVRVEMLSRFLTDKEAAEVIEGLSTGSVDVVIGTHRLLGEGVTFKSLGLLVVDEEQRFGVSHKETMKQMSIGVDVLTLTASPIPRTLEMGLTGIRDLSIIDTPPAERQPILTYVGEQDERAITEAIRRELLREGQAFFVHNRVNDIERTAARLKELVGDARIAIAHGQMDEGTLERVVLDFSDGLYDVLVCTTIIESGIDMPTVNTLVVDRADLLGLGQLHQLRGRVGRAGQRAYAYLFHPADRVLTEQAYERLRTIGEHTELGSGFKIAMRDLEIRGAGNLLGTDQSGHIAAVGYDLYVQMVAEAVAELKGEEVKSPAEVKLELPLDAHLPKDYVEREDLRLEAYRRLGKVETNDEVDDIEAEWLDRYGAPPRPASALLSVARLRAQCIRTKVKEVTVVVERRTLTSRREVTARISPIHLAPSARVRLTRIAPRAIYKEDIGQLIAPFSQSDALADELAGFISSLVPEQAQVVA